MTDTIHVELLAVLGVPLLQLSLLPNANRGQVCVRHLLRKPSLSRHAHTRGEVLLPAFLRLRHRSAQRLGNAPKVVQLTGGGGRVLTEV